jgi:hypothetical protein
VQQLLAQFESNKQSLLAVVVVSSTDGVVYNINRCTLMLMFDKCSVIGGLDVLDSIERVPTDAKNVPLTDIRITSVTIHANPLA